MRNKSVGVGVANTNSIVKDVTKSIILVIMMSEKRFYITDTGLGLDTESDEMYSFDDEEDFCRLFDKLNEQQSIIGEQKIAIDEMITDYKNLEKENGQLRHEIEIEKKWQLAQDRYYVKIKEENEQLRKELDNFKPIMFNSMQKGTIILYFKGGIDE